MRVNLFMLGLSAINGLAYAILSESDLWRGSIGLFVILVVAAAAAGVLTVRLLSWLAIDVGMRSTGRQPSKLLRLLVDAFLYGLAAIIVVKVVAGVDVSLLVAGSAVVTAVLGFALQATLENLFSGVAIQLEQPFAIGDFVRVGDVIGQVETVTWRATHLRTDTKSRLIIPNSQLSSGEVEILRASDVRAAREIEIHVPSAAPPGFVSRLIARVLDEVPNVADDPPPEVDARRFHARQDAIVYEISYVPVDFWEWEATEGTINERVWYALQRHGISMSLSGVNPRLDPGPASRPGRREIVDLLNEVAILSTLDDGARHVLAESATFRPYTDGEVVRPNPADALQIVLRGTIEQYGRLTAHTSSRFVGDRLADLRSTWDPAYLAELSRVLAPHVGRSPNCSFAAPPSRRRTPGISTRSWPRRSPTMRRVPRSCRGRPTARRASCITATASTSSHAFWVCNSSTTPRGRVPAPTLSRFQRPRSATSFGRIRPLSRPSPRPFLSSCGRRARQCGTASMPSGRPAWSRTACVRDSWSGPARRVSTTPVG